MGYRGGYGGGHGGGGIVIGAPPVVIAGPIYGAPVVPYVAIGGGHHLINLATEDGTVLPTETDSSNGFTMMTLFSIITLSLFTLFTR